MRRPAAQRAYDLLQQLTLHMAADPNARYPRPPNTASTAATNASMSPRVL